MEIAQYGRVKGAEWFPLLYKKDISVLGQGGIGSWVSLLLGRIGCSLHLYDYDTYEMHNLTGQFVRGQDVGKNKAQAAKELLFEFSPDCSVDVYGKFGSNSLVSDVMVCGFDNMAARILAFKKWRKYVETEGIASECFFIDGRLLAEQLQIFCIQGTDTEHMDLYEAEHLPTDDQVAEGDCTFKQTSHAAAMIASHMVGFLTNWTANLGSETPYRSVPFYYEYFIPLNLTS